MHTKYVWIAKWIDRFHTGFRRMSLYTKDHNIAGDGDGGGVLRWHRHCAIELRGTYVKSVIGKVRRLYTGLTIRTTIPREFPHLFRESKLSIASTRWQCPSRADLRKNIKRERADGTVLNKLPHCFILTTNSNANNNNNVAGESSDCKIISSSWKVLPRSITKAMLA